MGAMQQRAAELFRRVQDEICAAATKIDGKSFHEDSWTYPDGGGGRSRVLLEGNVFEKAGVNFSDVAGTFPADFAATMPGSGLAFRATGVSLILHPRNPKVPTVHANFRYIERGDGGWFGGGADLTPYYPYRDDCIAFHRVWKDACDRHPDAADYPKFKRWCDEYFFLKHRNEARGIGGIFFDYQSGDPEKLFSFVADAGLKFNEAYFPIVERRKDEEYSEAERDFQLFRRGRYVEFNLIYDRGTIFGLKTGGRTESILVSMPPLVKWLYNYQPPQGTWEEELYKCLEPQDWVNGPARGR